VRLADLSQWRAINPDSLVPHQLPFVTLSLRLRLQMSVLLNSRNAYVLSPCEINKYPEISVP